jgi:dienelactone hydrolase
MSDIQSRQIEYRAGGTALKGYLAWDGARQGRRPGVLVVHEWWGNSDYVRRRADMLAELGYAALAVDMYGEGRTADNPGDAGRLMNDLLADLGVVRQRFDAAMDVLSADPHTDSARLAAIGYCMGGGIVLHMARHGRDLRAVASFHGSLPLGIAAPGEGAEMKGRVAVYHGEDDSFIGADTVAAFRQEMREAGADCLFVTLPGALHGFTNPLATANGQKFGIPLRHSELADRCSWDHMRLVLESAFR